MQTVSADREIKSDDFEYVLRNIRYNYLIWNSVAFVLCGGETPYQKFGDWEIKTILDKEHGRVGINLPMNPSGLVPQRFFHNV